MNRHTTTLAVACAALFGADISAQGFQRDWMPTAREIVLNTNSTDIQPTSGPPVVVRGGLFTFRDVTIPANVRVRAEGFNPLVFVCSGTFTLNGVLSSDGADGQRVDTLHAANFPSFGGMPGAAGGMGGAGSPNSTDRSPSGAPGYGPFLQMNGGGGAGLLSCTSVCNRGSAGGGGSFTTQGDPGYLLLGQTPWPQVFGMGGEGCTNRSLPGGAAGPRPFVDRNDANDFWGRAYDVNQGRFVAGELSGPQGGAGGGGGGDRSRSCQIPDPNNFSIDNRGGGGGGGGGAIVIVCLGRVVIGPNSWISANGGHGGGGEQAGSNNEGGGGGGGSGGMIVLASSSGIEMHVDGQTWAGQGDGRFVLSADGGIGTQGVFGGTAITGKYDRLGTPAWNQKPAGGFGGLGLIQLMAPAGGNGDGTNTILDDHIDLFLNGQRLTGVAKAQALGWRGFPDANGTLVDDFGLPTMQPHGGGEMRPSPILLPWLP